MTVPAVLEVKNLRAGYAGREILKGVSFTLNADDFFAVIGPRGPGTHPLLPCVHRRSAARPAALARVSQIQLQGPKFGKFHETAGKLGEAPDVPEAIELIKLRDGWRIANREEREKIWHRMLTIHAEQQLSIGVVNNVQQPVVVSNSLKNVLEKGLYNWEPGALFGMYRPDTFWFVDARRN